jgi:hypothetical protein
MFFLKSALLISEMYHEGGSCLVDISNICIVCNENNLQCIDLYDATREFIISLHVVGVFVILFAYQIIICFPCMMLQIRFLLSKLNSNICRAARLPLGRRILT